MKLTKVSLAALVALGAFSSVASATPLERSYKKRRSFRICKISLYRR
ncbi:hypothetical protein [Campylobacter concisus]